MPVSGPKGALAPNTYLAGAAVIKYRAVMRGADVNSVLQATANAVPLGIAEDNQQTAARALRVADRPGETVLAEAGAAFALDALLTSDANGRLITAASTNKVHAIARQAAAALSDLVVVEIAPRGLLAP
jgi:hypothetical protein